MCPKILKTYMFRWSPLGVRMGVGGYPEMIKFKEVSSDDHQMSVGGVDGYPRSHVRGGGGRGGYHRSHVWGGGCTLPCDPIHDTCDVTYPLHIPPSMDRMTDTYGNISYPQLRLRTVIKGENEAKRTNIYSFCSMPYLLRE